LNLEEFNTLQTDTEGMDAVYNMQQLKELLQAVNPDIMVPDKGMPFADYRALYLDGRLRRAYSTDIHTDYKKLFGDKAVVVVNDEEFPLGSRVSIQGLKGAAELNGQQGDVVEPASTEMDVVAEGRVIVRLSDGERIALKSANLELAPTSAASVAD